MAYTVGNIQPKSGIVFSAIIKIPASGGVCSTAERPGLNLLQGDLNRLCGLAVIDA